MFFPKAYNSTVATHAGSAVDETELLACIVETLAV